MVPRGQVLRRSLPHPLGSLRREAGASDVLEAVLPELLPVLWDGGMHECMPRVIVSQEHYNYYGA